MHSSGSNSGFNIRLANAADIPALAEMINAAFSIETFLEGTRTDSDRLTSSMRKGEIFLAEASRDSGGRVLASVYTELRADHGYMGMLAVAPDLQGSGLARRLVLAAEDHFRRHGCKAVDISVLSLRPELLPIYRRFGFVETGTEEFGFARTFRDGAESHCILMSKPL
jgi:ribosomal protein S18 acetylase RimI-like enzyme